MSVSQNCTTHKAYYQYLLRLTTITTSTKCRHSTINVNVHQRNSHKFPTSDQSH